MAKFWKKVIWVALLTAAFTLTAGGCGDQKEESTDSVPSDSASPTGDVSSDSTSDSDTAVSSESVYAYSVNTNGTISITGYNGTETALNIPSSIDGYVVSAIADHAFEANTDIVSVTLPNGMTTISEGAFMDCTSLTSITISDTVSDIQRAAFSCCASLTSISLPETVSTVMEEVFIGCTSLTELTVANPSLEYDSWGLIEGSEPLAVTIICPSGSTIEAWASENGFATQPLS